MDIVLYLCLIGIGMAVISNLTIFILAIIKTSIKREGIAAARRSRKRAEQEKQRWYQALSNVQRLSYSEFEEYIEFIFQEMGYQTYGRGNANARDGGIDVKARRDGDYVVIQCKKYKSTITEPDVRGFMGAVVAEGADKGIFVTTSSFTEPAKIYARKVPIELVGPTQIIEWQQMLKIGPYVEPQASVMAVSTPQQVSINQYAPFHLRPQERGNNLDLRVDKERHPQIVKQGMSGWQVSIIIGLTAVATAICGCAGLAGLVAMVGPPPG